MLKTGLRPSDILTKAAFRNAITTVMALGGSTNAVLHFLAIARAAGVSLTLDNFQAGHFRQLHTAFLHVACCYSRQAWHRVAPSLQQGCAAHDGPRARCWRVPHTR